MENWNVGIEYTVDLEVWLFENLAAGEEDWRDLRRAIGEQVNCGMYVVTIIGQRTFVRGPTNTLVLETEATKARFLARLSREKWHLFGSRDGKDCDDCRTDH